MKQSWVRSDKERKWDKFGVLESGKPRFAESSVEKVLNPEESEEVFIVRWLVK